MKRVISFVLVLAMCVGMFVALKPNLAQAAKKTPGKPSITVTLGKDGKTATITIAKTKNAEGYLIYMSTDGSKFKKIKTLKADGSAARSYTVKKLSSDKTYAFKVKSYLKDGTKTVKSKYSKTKTLSVEPTPEPTKVPVTEAPTPEPTKAPNKTSFVPEKEFDYKEQIPYYADNAYDTEKLSSTISVGDSISFTKTIKINGEKGNAVFDLTDTEALKYLKENDPDEYEYLYINEIQYWDDPNYYKNYNELANIPILSEANKKGLEDGYTILGTKNDEESWELLKAWKKTSHINDITDTGVFTYNGGIANGSVTASENSLRVGDNGVWVNDETFSEKVYEVSMQFPSLAKVAKGKLKPKRYSSGYMECVTTLSFITSYPYEVATALIGNDKETGLFFDSSMRNKWIRVNDVLLYIDSENNLYMKPAD